MKKKDIEKLRGMDAQKLQSEADKIRQELAHLQLEMRMGNAKDTNAVVNKKKELAMVLTFHRQKRDDQTINSEKAK